MASLLLRQKHLPNSSSASILKNKTTFSFTSLLTLAACGGGGGGGNGGGGPSTPAPPAPPAAPVPTEITNFTETSENVFVANDAGGVLQFRDSTQDLTVTGGDGADSIFTGSGNDVVNAGAGSDGVGVSAGADQLDGGDGANDTLHAGNSPSGVHLNFDAGTSSGGYVEGDTITNFENAWLTPYDDVFVGNDQNNYVEIGGGDDIVDVRGGNDTVRIYPGANTVEGGVGVDTLVFDLSDAGVNINLTTNAASGGFAENNTLSGFENVRGSNFDDIITGEGSSNYIRGADGDDIINGEGGDDLLQGDGGDDIVNGGAGNDEFPDGLGADILNGQEGDDTFRVVKQSNSLTEDQYDGGTGTDTIYFDPFSNVEAYDVDLSLINALNIEQLELGNTFGDVNLTLSAQDVLDITDGGNQILVQGDAGDSLTSTGQGWVQGADQVIDTVTYNTYTSAGATLLIEEDISQTIS